MTVPVSSCRRSPSTHASPAHPPLRLLTSAGRQLLAEPSVVLALDAATSDVGPGLTSLENSEGDAAWGNPDDPAMTIQLHNAGAWLANSLGRA